MKTIEKTQELNTEMEKLHDWCEANPGAYIDYKLALWQIVNQEVDDITKDKIICRLKELIPAWEAESSYHDDV